MKNAFALFVLISLLISTCRQETVVSPTATISRTPTRTPRPTITYAPTHTPTITLTPTMTSTPQPPLEIHEWWPERVLVLHDIWPRNVYFPPSLIMYADGLLFVTKYSRTAAQMYFKKLDRKDLCQNLNTLDQLGYLDYEPSTFKYSGGYIYDASAEIINVDAWKSTRGSYYAFWLHLYYQTHLPLPEGYTPPVIPLAPSQTYQFLSNYPVDNMEIYEPDRILFSIRTYPHSPHDSNPSDSFGPWPFREYSLNSLWKKSGSPGPHDTRRYIVLEGEQARSIYSYLGRAFYFDNALVFEDTSNGQVYYEVFARPILPFELPGEYGSDIPAPGSTKPNFKLTCYPSDGIMPLPTP